MTTYWTTKNDRPELPDLRPPILEAKVVLIPGIKTTFTIKTNLASRMGGLKILGFYCIRLAAGDERKSVAKCVRVSGGPPL